MDACPSREELELLLADELQPGRADAVRRHLVNCGECRARRDDLQQGADDAAQLLRYLPEERRPRVVDLDNFDESKPPFLIPDFDLIRQLGRGGLGSVWLARNKITGVHYAAKLVDSPSAARIEVDAIKALERLASERRNCVTIRHVGRVGAGLYYIMRLADGYGRPEAQTWDSYEPRTLAADLIRRRVYPPAEAIRTTLDVLAGVAALHNDGLLHRDIKPANILFVDGTACLGDLGLVASATDKAFYGKTPGFAPVEGVVDHSGDLFCVGRLLIVMMAGKLPSQNEEQPVLDEWRKSHNRPLPALAGIVAKAIQKDSQRRFQSAAEMSAELRALLPEALLKSRRRWLIRGAILAGVAGCAGAAWVFWPRPTPLEGRLDILVQTPPAKSKGSSEGEPPTRLTQDLVPLVVGQKVGLSVELNRRAYPVVALLDQFNGRTRAQIAYPPAAGSQPRTARIDHIGPIELEDPSGALAFVLIAGDAPCTDLEGVRTWVESAFADWRPGDKRTIWFFENGRFRAERRATTERTKGFGSVTTQPSFASEQFWGSIKRAPNGLKLLFAEAVHLESAAP